MIPVAIEKTFLNSANKLEIKEKGAVLNFIVKFTENATSSGISLERLSKHSNKHLWSARITQDLRAIVFQIEGTWALIYVAHHDDAYKWANNRTIEKHPVTGAIQLIRSAEEIEKKIEHKRVDPSVKGMFHEYKDKYLLSLGVPESWLETIRKIKIDEHLMNVIEAMPEEIGERLFDLAHGEFVTPPKIEESEQGFEHQDTRRNFWVLTDGTDIQKLLNKPIEVWMRFLHPNQKKIVETEFKGPSKITGAAGTGKTVVALHRAKYLAKKGVKTLLTTYSKTLCDNLKYNLRLLCNEEELKKIPVSTVHHQALKLVQKVDENIVSADYNAMPQAIKNWVEEKKPYIDQEVILREWEQVIKNNGYVLIGEYLSKNTTVDGKRLKKEEKEIIWSCIQDARDKLLENNEMDWQLICRKAIDYIKNSLVVPEYNAVIVDELQDLRPAEIQLLSLMSHNHPENIMLIGDTGQRIYGGNFNLSNLGIKVLGRSTMLKLNYRTTEQIRDYAEELLEYSVDDMDGGVETRLDTHSLLQGPVPFIRGFEKEIEETEFVVDKIQEFIDKGYRINDMAVFSRSGRLLEPVKAALVEKNISIFPLRNDCQNENTNGVKFGTMHRAKGLEFKIVFIIGCDDLHLPHFKAIDNITNKDELKYKITIERNLFYVSITRARDEVFISYHGKASRFINKSETLDELVDQQLELFGEKEKIEIRFFCN